MARSTTESANFFRIASGSRRRSLTKAKHRMNMTMAKGSAEMIVMFFRLVSAAPGSSPPASSMMAATAPVSTPQNTITRLEGSMRPSVLSEPMTIEAESAPVTKKMPIKTMARRAMANVTPGVDPKCLIRSNRAPWKSTDGTPSTIVTIEPEAPPDSTALSWMLQAVPPKIENQMTVTRGGTRSTPVTNWRMVRPRLIRAMNMPTNGAQETHHAQ